MDKDVSYVNVRLLVLKINTTASVKNPNGKQPRILNERNCLCAYNLSLRICEIKANRFKKNISTNKIYDHLAKCANFPMTIPTILKRNIWAGNLIDKIVEHVFLNQKFVVIFLGLELKTNQSR